MWRLVLLAAIIYFLLKWLRHGAPPARRERPLDPQRLPVEEMVKDPSCGIWVPVSQAITVGQGQETLHFCSPECRDRFLDEKAKGKRY